MSDGQVIDTLHWPPSAVAALDALYADNERLRAPWRAVDDADWHYIIGTLGDGGRGRHWKAVLTEVRAALNPQKEPGAS